MSAPTAGLDGWGIKVSPYRRVGWLENTCQPLPQGWVVGEYMAGSIARLDGWGTNVNPYDRVGWLENKRQALPQG